MDSERDMDRLDSIAKKQQEMSAEMHLIEVLLCASILLFTMFAIIAIQWLAVIGRKS